MANNVFGELFPYGVADSSAPPAAPDVQDSPNAPFGSHHEATGQGVHPSGMEPKDYVRFLEEGRFSEQGKSASSPVCPLDPEHPVGIAGAGLMGCSIAASFLRKSLPVLLYDSLEGARAAAPERIEEELARQIGGNGPDSAEPTAEARKTAARLMKHLQVAETPGELVRCGAILETIVEKTKHKQKFYQSLEAVLEANGSDELHRLLLTNTSTIRITELAKGLRPDGKLDPARFCGFHFFHPVRKRSLVEIIRGARTNSATVAAAEVLVRAIDKSPIVVADGPGFLVNRILNPYLEEAMVLLLEGVPMDRIESVCRRFGMEMGPFRIMDEIGLDVVFHSGWTFFKAFPEYIRSGELLPAMIEAGRLGRKNGRGFRNYEKTGSWSDAGKNTSEVDSIVKRIAEATGLRAGGNTVNSGNTVNGAMCGPKAPDEVVAARIFLSILTESARATEAGIVQKIEDADRALCFGLGFPKSRGGIAFWADCAGLPKILEACALLKGLNPKFEAPALIRETTGNGTLVLNQNGVDRV